jgi:tetratricopeptide (TPR) repeat protein
MTSAIPGLLVKSALEPTAVDRHSTAVPPRKEAKNRRAHREARRPAGGPDRTAARRAGPSAAALSLLPALLAVALYLPALPHGWVWDDRFLVVTHGTGGVGAEGFRLLTSLLYRLEWTLGFGTPVIAHLVGVLLHGIATWLFARIAIQVGAKLWIAFLAALLFAAHPVHVEAVAYVSGRPDLLATVLALAALLLARTAELCSPEGCRSWKIWPAYAALAAALLSDEVAVVTPLILVALDRWGPVRVPWRRRLTHYAGFFAIALVYLLVRYTVGGGATPAGGTAHASSGIEDGVRSWAVPMAFAEYMKMLVWPHPLNALRSLQAADVAAWSARLSPLVALLGVALVTLWRRRDPLARAGAVLLLLPLIPALPLPFFVGSFAEERAAYFASVGICLLAGSVYAWAAGAIRMPRLVLGAGAVAIAALAAWATLQRLPVWRDNIALLQAAAEAEPGDPQPHLMLAEYHAQDGNLRTALEEVDRAIALDPSSHSAFATKTTLLSRLGRYPESEAAARRSIALAPGDAVSYANLSDALMQQGKIAPAVEAARRAVEIDSTLSNAWYNYGVALVASGDAPGAIRAYEKALALQPDNIVAMNNLGALFGSTGRLEEARDLYIKLLALAPNSLEARMNLALAYLRLGDRDNAAREREAVRRISPSSLRQLDVIFSEYIQRNPRTPPGRPSR